VNDQVSTQNIYIYIYIYMGNTNTHTPTHTCDVVVTWPSFLTRCL
jgi:hypothetical protein